MNEAVSIREYLETRIQAIKDARAIALAGIVIGALSLALAILR